MSSTTSSSIIANIIAKSTKLKGDLELDTVMRIDGFFSGSIKSTSKVLIGEEGVAKCNIEADIIEIGGEFEGNIIGKTIIKVFSTGKVNGDIQAPKIIIEEGVIYNGAIKVTS